MLYCDLIEGSCEMVPDTWSETTPYADLSWMWQCLVIAMLFYVLTRLKKGRGTVRSLLTVQGTCMRNALLAFPSPPLKIHKLPRKNKTSQLRATALHQQMSKSIKHVWVNWTNRSWSSTTYPWTAERTGREPRRCSADWPRPKWTQ